MSHTATYSSSSLHQAGLNGIEPLSLSKKHQLKPRNSTGIPPFLGKLQPTASRVPATPPVNYSKGGSDFRCPSFQATSSIGRQLITGTHKSTAPRTRFGTSERFQKSETLGVGPAAAAPQSSLKRQLLSTKKSAGSMNFGTSTRDGAKKLYTIYTAKRF